MTNDNNKPGFINYVRDNWVRLYFGAAVLLVVFAYGIAVGVWQLFPYSVLLDGVKAARDWNQNAEQYARIAPSKHLRPARREGICGHVR